MTRDRPLSLSELVLLNDEIRALIRAGIPLDVGLRGSALRLRGRIADISERLGQHIDAGMSLQAALEAESPAIPVVYRAILAAGLRTGRLDEVLGRVSEFAATMSDLESHLMRALFYPLTVVLLAYVLFVAIIRTYVDRVEDLYLVLRMDPPSWLPTFQWLRNHVHLWGPGIPLLVLAVWFLPVLLERIGLIRGSALLPRRSLATSLLSLVGVRRYANLARFTHLLALLTQYEIPFPEAARLSGAATGDERLMGTVNNVVRRVESGQPLSEALQAASTWPPFLRWLITVGEQQSSLAPLLQQAGEVYRQRTLSRAAWIQRVVPVCLLFVIGGGITTAYALTVFVPLSSMWKSLGAP